MDELDEIRKKKLEKLMSDLNKPSEPQIQYPNKPIVITDKDLEQSATQYPLLILDCWAEWCGPCKALSPILEELEEKYRTNRDIRFLKLNTDEYQAFAIRNRIRGIPCVLIFFNGEPARLKIKSKDTGTTTVVDRLIGLRPAEHFESAIESLLKGK